MLRKHKQFLLGFLIGSLLFSSITVFADITEIKAFLSDIKIALNGQVLELKDVNGNKVKPIVYNGTTYLPVRALANAFEKEVSFNGTTNIVEITDKITQVSTKLNEPANKNYIEDELTIYEVSGGKFITLNSLYEKYKEKGYIIGYDRLNTGIIKTDAKVLLQNIPLFSSVNDNRLDNNYYVEYKYFIDKIEPLFKAGE